MKLSTLVSFFGSPYFLILELVLFSFIAVSLAQEFIKRSEVNKEIQKIQLDLAKYQGENQKIKTMIEFTKSESFFEEEARQRLGLAKPGEKVIILVHNDSKGNLVGETQGANEAGDSISRVPGVEIPTTYKNVVNWWNYFFGY